MRIRDIDHYGSLAKFVKSAYSQDGSDGIIEEVFNRIGVPSGVFVELGAGDGISLSNTRNLLDNKGWTGALIEASPDYFQILKSHTVGKNVVKINSKVNCEPGNTLDDLLDQNNVPEEIDLLSLDIDSIEYWVWKSMRRKPKLVIVEYNANFHPDECKTVAYEPSLCWTLTAYYGASFGALNKLAREKGYTLVAASHGLNLFFVRNDFKHLFDQYDGKELQKSYAWPPESRVMIDV